MAMNPALIKLMSATHLFWYQLTGGFLGGRVSGAPVLLLTTTGRKSGQRRTRPLLYLRDGDSMVVVASNGGNDQHPAWWLNLKKNPEAEVQLGSAKKRVRAEKANEDERNRLWPLIVKMYRRYEDYQKGTRREIPLVILRPEG